MLGILFCNINNTVLLSKENVLRWELSPDTTERSDSIAYVNLPDFRTTWSLNAVLLKENDHYSVIIIYPGTPAPSFPDVSQHTPEECAAFDMFWKSHAFIMTD